MTPKRTPLDLGALALSLCSLFLVLNACGSGLESDQEDTDTQHTGECGVSDSGVGDSGVGDSGVGDSGGTDTSPPSDPFFGDPYLPPLDLPAFQALNADGSPRSQADLLEHPTILWFFRQAGGST